MTHSLTIASWNIGGGYTFDPASKSDRAGEDLGYFATRLAESSPDIVCLQEAHSYESRESQCAQLAEMLNYDHYANFPMSTSHIEAGALLSLAVLSKYPITGSEYHEFRTPDLSSEQPNGDVWTLFPKGACSVRIDLDGRELSVVNAHQHPFHYFGVTAFDEQFRDLWEDTERVIREAPLPSIVAIDSNASPIRDLMPSLAGDMWISQEGVPTTPKGAQQDYFLTSSGVDVSAEPSVIETLADHHLLALRATVIE